jgi:preprotein translocase subunit YajC
VLLIGIFYFMLYRPQQKQRRQREELIASLEVGKTVVTIGGIHGEVKEIGDETLTLTIAEDVDVVFQKTAVAFLRQEPDLSDEENEDSDYQEEEDAESAVDADTVSDEEPILDEPVEEDVSGRP